MAAGYDHTTWFYERLSKLIFGQAQVEAQAYFLSRINPQSNILIIGGGTGQILESISRLHPSGLHITYVEISPKMMALSRKRHVGQNEVKFITVDIAAANFTHQFDVVITAFLFDNFTDAELAVTFPKIDQCVKQGALWLDTDFQLTGALWQKCMLGSMYAFFKVMKAVKVSRLPDSASVFAHHQYQLTEQKEFYGRFIYSRMFSKSFR